jgi:hypothetical protein
MVFAVVIDRPGFPQNQLFGLSGARAAALAMIASAAMPMHQFSPAIA